MTRSVIILTASGNQLECGEEHPSLLAALEAHDMCMEFQCRQGYCGACRLRLLKGEVSYTSQPLAAVQQGEILPCCCRARGDIELDL